MRDHDSSPKRSPITLRKYHMGCGERRLDGFFNVDVRETQATDAVLDLNEPVVEPGTAECFFSHAFFEHLFRLKREPHLRALRRALHDQRGFVCYLGLPDFEQVAREYLRRGPGITGPRFDLYEVYRYTHGDPEAVDGWYFEQLHKSLFDLEEVDVLLTAAGYPSYVVFSYIFDDEAVPVTLGFYARRSRQDIDELRDDCLSFLKQFDEQFLRWHTIEFKLRRSRGLLDARRAAWRVQWHRAATRLASGLSARGSGVLNQVWGRSSGG